MAKPIALAKDIAFALQFALSNDFYEGVFADDKRVKAIKKFREIYGEDRKRRDKIISRFL